jgi:hypothetical protein
MRMAGIALVLFALAHAYGADLLNSDFEDLKRRLVGTWSFTENGQPDDATFEAIAHGHAILERNSGFIAVYHPDGVHSMLMTLYTRDGNQPRLRAKGFGENPASIAIEKNATIGVHTLFRLQSKRHATVPPKRTDA